MQTQGTAEPLPKSKWTLFNAPTVEARGAPGGGDEHEVPPPAPVAAAVVAVGRCVQSGRWIRSTYFSEGARPFLGFARVPLLFWWRAPLAFGGKKWLRSLFFVP